MQRAIKAKISIQRLEEHGLYHQRHPDAHKKAHSLVICVHLLTHTDIFVPSLSKLMTGQQQLAATVNVVTRKPVKADGQSP